MTRSFFDSNIFVYADDDSSPAKKKVAIDLIESHHRRGLIVVSLQVLVEYFNVATKKLRITPEAAQRRVEFLARDARGQIH
jgi:predicted nucleic acid-binding protein